jgi:hypothetical protein
VIWLAVAAVVLVERLAPLEHDAPREALRAAIERRQR